jgi:hypothetical protein
LVSLILFEAYPRGYVCILCKPEERKIYSSLEAVWIDHGFEECLNWVNSKLKKSRWLALYQVNHHGLASTTWVKLVEEPDQEAKVNLSVWVDNEMIG